MRERPPRSHHIRAHWYFQWFTVLFLGVTLVVGAAYRIYKSRTATEVSYA
ncbi:hypothetical protein [Streptomyces sp. 4N124]